MLIITCPCALALAVPAVQVVASGALFRGGVLLNSADAIERLQAMVDEASIRPVYRVPTRPTKASKERRLKAKTTRASIKSGRGKPSLD